MRMRVLLIILPEQVLAVVIPGGGPNLCVHVPAAGAFGGQVGDRPSEVSKDCWSAAGKDLP
jgi:hypothetical protein